MRQCQLALLLLLVLVKVAGAQHIQDTHSDVKISKNIPQELRPTLSGITADKIFAHIQVLASDSFEGRAPVTKGETLTLDYLVNHFKKTGVKPGNANGSYLQAVPLVGFHIQKAGALLTKGSTEVQLTYPDDLLPEAFKGNLDGTIENSDVLFAGYGIVAPEYGWDDYKNINVKGKTVIVLSGDPQIKVSSYTDNIDTAYLKSSTFGFRAHKYDVAAKRGAAALFIVYTSPAAFKSIQSTFVEQLDIKPDVNKEPLKTQGILSWNAFQNLCKFSGVTPDSLQKGALNKNFSPLPLGIQATIEVQSNRHETKSYNVVAKVEGTDKIRKNECIIYTAHWDHLGKDTTRKGDQIFNGAIDNALGVASILEVAAGLAKLKEKPKRSILFLLTTAEEKRFLGSKYYIQRPLYPLSKTIANINKDGGANPWGETKEVYARGSGLSTLDELLEQAAAMQGRTYMKKTDIAGLFYRSDQIEFALRGIPAIYPTSTGADVIGKERGNGAKNEQEYFSSIYHTVSDEVKSGWNLAGAAQETQLLLLLGYRLAQTTSPPQLNERTEFKSIRKRMLEKK